jgi:hypothetical protein
VLKRRLHQARCDMQPIRLGIDEMIPSSCLLRLSDLSCVLDLNVVECALRGCHYLQ